MAVLSYIIRPENILGRRLYLYYKFGTIYNTAFEIRAAEDVFYGDAARFAPGEILGD